MMKTVALGFLLALAACAGPNSAINTATFVGKSAFAAAIETFNVYRDACAAKTLPSSCRAYVVKGQGIIKQAYEAEKVGNTVLLSSAVSQLTAIASSLKGLKG